MPICGDAAPTVADRVTPEFAAPDILAHEISAYLENDIIALRLPPGQRLIEEDIGRRFGVSRSPIREAMRLLESSGLVQRSPRRGSIVAPLSRDDLDAVSACRVPLESLASAGAADHATDRQRAALGASLQAMETATVVGDTEAAFAANVALTDIVHDACGNPVLRRLLSGVNKLALRYRFISYRRVPDLVGTSLAANRDLVLPSSGATRTPPIARRKRSSARTGPRPRHCWRPRRRLRTSQVLVLLHPLRPSPASWGGSGRGCDRLGRMPSLRPAMTALRRW